MQLRLFVLIACLVAPLLAASAELETTVAKFSGHNNSQTKDFDVKGPWLLDFQVNSEFPDLAATAIRLENAAGQTVGVVADFAGTGRGLKLFRKSGTYHLDITGDSSDWTVEITEISDAWAARLEQMTATGRSEPELASLQQKQVFASAFNGWRPGPDGTLILIGTGAMSFRVSFGPGGCPKLAKAKTLSFVTPEKGPHDVYNSILFDDGTRCYFDKVTWVPHRLPVP
jgi:hypothetical protein